MTAEQLTKVNDYFNNIMNVEDFTLNVRRLLFATTTLHFNDKDKVHEDWIKDGVFWLNDFIEIIDPHLEKKD